MKKTTFYLLFGICFLFAMATADDCKPAQDDDCTCAIECPVDTCNTANDDVPCVSGDDLTSAGGVCTCTKTCPTEPCDATDGTTKCSCKPIAPAVAACDADTTGAGEAGDCACTRPTDDSCVQADACAAIDEDYCTCTKPCTACDDTKDCSEDGKDFCKCTKGSASVTSSTVINIMLPLMVTSFKFFNYVIV